MTLNIINTIKALFIQIEIADRRRREIENGIANAEVPQKVPYFLEACRKAGVEPTKRQARKFRKGTGGAFKHQHLTLLGRPVYNQKFISNFESEE